MSALLRFCLRVAAVEILRADPVIAAATSGRVYDSKMGDIDPGQPLPAIIVHSEGMHGTAFSANNGGPPFNAQSELVFEITHIAKAEQNDEPGLFLPETDRELEAAIELLEWRISDALAFAETPLALAVRRLVLKRIREVSSERFSSDDVGVRLATRFVTLTVEFHDEESIAWHPDDELPTGDFASLPDPLRSIAPLFPAGSSARETFLLVANRLPAPAAGDEFTGADITVTPTPAPGP